MSAENEQPPWLLVVTGLERVRQDIADLSQKVAGLERVSDELRDIHQELISAFPGNDVQGHRRYHDSVIAQLEQRTKMLQNLAQHLINALALSAVFAIGAAVWNYTSVKSAESAMNAGIQSQGKKGGANETHR